MSLWRIRVAVPDDPGSHSALDNALAGHCVSGVRVLPGGAAASSCTSEIMIELPAGDGLATVLSALHEISPQVFLSRADMPSPAASPAAEPSAPEPVA